MCHQKNFPRYDEIQHIDSAAVDHRTKNIPRTEPDMLNYTELYCQSSSRIESDGATDSKR